MPPGNTGSYSEDRGALGKRDSQCQSCMERRVWSNLEHKEAKVVAWSPQCKCEKFMFSLETVKLKQD